MSLHLRLDSIVTWDIIVQENFLLKAEHFEFRFFCCQSHLLLNDFVLLGVLCQAFRCTFQVPQINQPVQSTPGVDELLFSQECFQHQNRNLFRVFFSITIHNVSLLESRTILYIWLLWTNKFRELRYFSHLATILHSPTTARESTIGFSPLSFKQCVLNVCSGYFWSVKTTFKGIFEYEVERFRWWKRTFSDSGKRKSTIIGLYLLPWSFTWLGQYYHCRLREAVICNLNIDVSEAMPQLGNDQP